MTDTNELRNDTHLDSMAKRILSTIDRSKVDDHELAIFTEYLRDEQVKQKPIAVEIVQPKTEGTLYQVANRGVDLTIRFPSPASFGIFVEWLFARTGAEAFCEYSKKREQRCAIGKLTPCYVNSLANVNDARQYNQFLSSRLIIAEPAEDSGETPVTNKMTVGSAAVPPHPIADAAAFGAVASSRLVSHVKPRQQMCADAVEEAAAFREAIKKPRQVTTRRKLSDVLQEIVDRSAEQYEAGSLLKDVVRQVKELRDKVDEAEVTKQEPAVVKEQVKDKATAYDPACVNWYPTSSSDVVSVRELIIERLSHLSVSINVMLRRYQEGKGEQWDAHDFLSAVSPYDPETLLDMRYMTAVQLITTDMIDLCEQYLENRVTDLPVEAWLNRIEREFKRLLDKRQAT